jgi:hypothetical protein
MRQHADRRSNLGTASFPLDMAVLQREIQGLGTLSSVAGTALTDVKCHAELVSGREGNSL